MTLPVLEHRLILRPEFEIEGLAVPEVVERILQEITEISIKHDVALPASLALTGKALAQMQLATAQPWFVPASRLNALRRDALERINMGGPVASEAPPHLGLVPERRGRAVEPQRLGRRERADDRWVPDAHRALVARSVVGGSEPESDRR